GVYGLTFVTVLIFTATGLLPNKKPLVFALILASVITAGGWLRLYQATPEDVFGVHLRIVQPNIQQTLKWNPQKAEDNLNTLIRLSKTKNEEITHVIWPESAIPYLLENNPTERLRLMSAIRQGGTLITGALRIVSREKRQLANSIFMIDHLANIIGYADKAHLVPFGEYIPFRNILPLDKVVPIQSDFVAGKKVKTIMVPKAVPAALLVCYEIIFSGRVTDKNNRPQWIVNVTNDGWYGISPGPFQHLGMAQLRAVEEGLPVVRAANTGISALISPYGEILSYKALNTQGVIDTKLPRATEPTIYSQFGYKPFIVFVVLIYLIMIWHSLINIGKRRTNHKKENTKNQKST
ncbi:MAG: apolipoprotein N-acyltransferase, partial [Alphaproteobacteria bacterium]|nr:apolipoprotein N-acyltransferase [Alphaproteobacteria bacterium]